MTTPRPALFGEILFDRFPDGSRVLGGAPLNVAAHLAQLGARPILVSQVGRDDAGEEALARLEALGIETSGIGRSDDLPTGEVDVTFDGTEPRFEIVADRAWDAIVLEPALAARIASEASLLYHGVLAARSPASRTTLERLRRLSGLPLFVDLNLRPPWTPVDRARRLAAGATCLKVSRDELASLTGAAAVETVEALESQAGEARRELGIERMFVTWGERGAWRFALGRPIEHAAAEPLVAEGEGDSVGAGDALAAALILGTLLGWNDAQSLARGAELAAAVCEIRGAIPAGPEFYVALRRRWELAG